MEKTIQLRLTETECMELRAIFDMVIKITGLSVESDLAFKYFRKIKAELDAVPVPVPQSVATVQPSNDATTASADSAP